MKTRSGANYLRDQKHMEKFKEDILSVDVSLNKKRASLWALGHIGSNENGIHLILEQELVLPIIKLAENADILSLRGTCIYIIGMLSNTPVGRAAIQKHGWIASKTKGITSVCLPRNPQTLFSVPRYDYKGNMSSDDKIMLAFQSLKRHVVLNNEE